MSLHVTLAERSELRLGIENWVVSREWPTTKSSVLASHLHKYYIFICFPTPTGVSYTPYGRSHTNTLPGHLPPMELRPPRAKKSHTQNSSPWNSVENSQMLQTPKVRDIQNTMEHKSHPPRTRYMFHHTSNGIA